MESNPENFAWWTTARCALPWLSAEERKARGDFLIDLARTPHPNQVIANLTERWGWADCSDPEHPECIAMQRSRGLVPWQVEQDATASEKLAFSDAWLVLIALRKSGLCQQLEAALQNRLMMTTPITAQHYERHLCESPSEFWFGRALMLSWAARYLVVHQVDSELLRPASLANAAEQPC